MKRPTIAEVDLSAVRDNIKSIRARVGPRVKIMPAVKANGYGHGAIEISRACLESGAHSLGVAGLDEAIELRVADIESPILILGCSERKAVEGIVEYGVSATCCDLPFARKLSEAAEKQGKPGLVHIKIDTGMGRIGVQPEEAVDFVKQVAALPGITIEGVFTHFPCADEPDGEFTLGQIAAFKDLIAALRREVPAPFLAHASNSGGVLAHPEGDFDAVRPGIMVYGLYPSTRVSKSIEVREALTLKTRVVFVKQSPPGTGISYGRTHTLSRKSVIATLPIGYGDGYPRLLSNKGEAVVRGSRVPIVGRVCMDQTMIDVTDVPGVEVGDEVILYGGGYEFLNLSLVAEKAQTISYELLCNIAPRVPRIYLNR